MFNKDPKVYLNDIIGAINKIFEYTNEIDFEYFCTDQKTLDAVIRNFEILGEAAKNLPDDFKEKYNELPWQQMMSMRNKVIHEYFGVDPEILWQTIKKDLPGLLKKLENL